ncbi:ATP-binding domain-containing protein [Achromobacter sp.]|uniref:ATP-binding domain-containing protein n=1 Tax=Achromobacter sp. TaxID=134375 RepID=UPI0028AE4995|nr:ATP-binding domain-containing protein [Achromobacter sp.]
MAQIVPDGWQHMDAVGGMRRELETLGVLAQGLPDDYTVYHAVHWTNIECVHAIHGEIDFVVVNRAGHMMLIEQKCGDLEETSDGLAKNYGGKLKSVPVQMARTVNSFRTRLTRTLPGEFVGIEHLLFCPDYLCRSPQTAGVVPERIVDARKRDDLCSVIRQILPAADPAPLRQKVDRFLCDVIQLETDASALVGQAKALVTRVSSGLAYWARQLDMTPFRLHVTGTAGSGKTQLALAEYRATLEGGRRPLYLCFNRPLADHISMIAPPGGMVCTFHMLCERMMRHTGAVPDFTSATAFDRLVAACAGLTVPEEFLFDTVIVDEGQDIRAEWYELIQRHAREGARLLWLEDPMQKLYRHDAVSLTGWTRLRADRNFRSPRSVVRLLQALVPDDVSVVSASPVAGHEMEVLIYANGAELTDKVKEGLQACLDAGFAAADIALLSYRGRDSSRILSYDQLGSHVLKKFQGTYDGEGRPGYSQGEFLADTVHRFKGQSAPAVVLAEIDFETIGEEEARRLFVGATRAAMKLVLVMSERAALQLLTRI